MKYERIRYNDKTIYLADTQEFRFCGKNCVRGTEVTKEAECRTDHKGRFVDHVIELRLVTKRTQVFLDPKYCLLEPAK